MKKVLILLSLAFLATSCGGVDNETLKDQVLDAHDEVMPKMGQLMKLKKQVLAKAATMDSTSTAVAELNALAQDLDDAHKGMMDWMHDWSKEAKPHIEGTASKEETTSYYQGQQVRVDKVKADINDAIAAAEKALK